MSCLALALAGCGADDPHFAPLSGAEPLAPLDTDANGDADSAERSRRASTTRGGEGALEVTAKSAVTSYLSRLHAVVTDAKGRVVAGADAEAEDSSAAAAPDLRLTVPEGDEYTLTLTASTTDFEPTSCRAVVGPLSVAADAVASVRVLAWDCGGPTGYVPSKVASECFWLAEWLFVGRTQAAVGEDIEVSAAGHDAQGNLARFDWTVTRPSLGRFAEPKAARTSFRCQEAGVAQPLTVAISDAECQAELSQNVACR
jgi:hypothetical protein